MLPTSVMDYPKRLGNVMIEVYRVGVRLTRIGKRPNGALTTIGVVLGAGGLSLIPAAALDLIIGDGHETALVLAALVLMAAGLGLLLVFRMPHRLSTDQLFMALVAAAAAMVVAGAVVHLATGAIDRIDRALIEATAGVTTTAVSLIERPEDLSRGEQLFRGLLQWGGGGGAIVAIVRVFPRLGHGGLDAEGGVATRSASRLSPTVGGNLRRLGAVYLTFTVLIAIAFAVAGMPTLDAAFHALTTASTGGWSTRSGSIGAFDSAMLEWVTALAMFGAGLSLPFVFQILRTRRVGLLFRSVELKVYVGLTIVSWWLLVLWSGDASATSIRRAAFAATSAISTTGMLAGATSAFDEAGTALLVILIVVGGMAASMSGGIRIARVLVLLSVMRRELVRQAHSASVRSIHIGASSIGEAAVGRLVGEVILNLLAFGAGFAALASAGIDVRSAMGTAASMLATAGPAYGSANPGDALLELDDIGRAIAAALMFLGHISVMPVLAVVASGSRGFRRRFHHATRRFITPAARR
jgi:trk system potassium uptake protein TrkH